MLNKHFKALKKDNWKKLNNKSLLLFVVILAILGLTGLYVYDSSKDTDIILNNTTKTNDSNTTQYEDSSQSAASEESTTTSDEAKNNSTAPQTATTAATSCDEAQKNYYTNKHNEDISKENATHQANVQNTGYDPSDPSQRRDYQRVLIEEDQRHQAALNTLNTSFEQQLKSINC